MAKAHIKEKIHTKKKGKLEGKCHGNGEFSGNGELIDSEIQLNIKPTNEPYTLVIKAPLLRPGLELSVGPFSKKYALTAIIDAMEIIRSYNKSGKNYSKK